jgi:uncharacterized protein YihD (DUF1040 family)
MKKLLLIVTLLLSFCYGEWSDSLDRAYSITKEKTKEVYNSAKKTIVPEPKTEKELDAEEFRETWDDVFDKYKEGTLLLEERLSAPKSAWFVSTKADYQEEIDEVINDILGVLTRQNLLEYKEKIAKKKEEIVELRNRILYYREKRIGAPKESMIYTTKKEYTDEIKNSQDEVAILENDIRMVKKRLEKSFLSTGIELNSQQLDVLLSRVDGDDIIQMSVVMKVLNKITQQILVLMQESGEELSQAKRYYGMHLISWQLVYYIQQRYIDRVKRTYIPEIDNIIKQTNRMMSQTSVLIDKEREAEKRLIYQKNFEIQKETQYVAIEYKKQLLEATNEMKKAQEMTESNIRLSQNIYNTVSLSSELYSVISESQKMFNKIAKIQMPKIIPFENLQIRKKYEEITGELLKEH